MDYAGDVAFLQRLFRRYMKRKPRFLLDIGCGTGSHGLLFVRRGYEVTGLDASASMLAVARRKSRPEDDPLHLIHGDMRSFRLGRMFDAAVCMFGAFGYLLGERDVTGCLTSVRRHLAPDGLFVFEYWQTSAVRPNHQSWLDRSAEENEIIRFSESRFDSRRSRLAMDFRFLVIANRRVLDRFSERHVARTYTRGEIGRFLRKTGFGRVGEFGVTPKLKQFRRVTPETFRIMAIARPRAQS